MTRDELAELRRHLEVAEKNFGPAEQGVRWRHDCTRLLAHVEGLEKAARELVEALPRCFSCVGPATKSSEARATTYCDAHYPQNLDAGYPARWTDASHAAPLRALLAELGET